MGMFDSIKCKAILPITKTMAKQFSNIDFNEIRYQTKDLECTLSNYLISDKGYLYNEIIKGHWVENPKPKGHKGRWWWPHKFVEESRVNKKVKHTGDIYFYDHIPNNNGDEYWIEFKAIFVKGKLDKITLFEKSLYKTKKQLDEDAKHIQDIFERDAKSFRTRSRKFLNMITFDGYNHFIRFIARFFHNLSESCKKIQSFIYRNL